MKIKKLLPSLLVLCTVFCTALPYSGYISNQTTSLTLNSSDTTDSASPYSDHLVWKYKYENGKFYKRLFNATTGVWMTDWILVS
ncbi:MAG: hypothetical protein ACLTPC_02940 [Lacrimispora saccharolytica]